MTPNSIHTKEQAPAALQRSEANIQTPSTQNNTTPRKWQRVLDALSSGRSFNRFEAERQLNDHCLHTTVSTLQGMGLVIHRRFETVPGYQRIPTRVRRYWLADESRRLAQDLLGQKALPGIADGGDLNA